MYECMNYTAHLRFYGYAAHGVQREVDKAYKLCRGVYQHGLISGAESLSGASLIGKASAYGSKYARSRRNLLERLRQNGVMFREIRRGHGKRILVIG